MNATQTIHFPQRTPTNRFHHRHEDTLSRHVYFHFLAAQAFLQYSPPQSFFESIDFLVFPDFFLVFLVFFLVIFLVVNMAVKNVAKNLDLISIPLEWKLLPDSF